MSLWVEIKRLFALIRTQGLRHMLIAGVDKLVRWITGRPSYRFGWITPSILLGGQPAKHVWPRLIDHGITAVINLRDEHDYHAEIGDLPLRYLRLPTIDNTPPTVDHLWQGVRFLDDEISRGGKVYVHCWEGLGRSPTMVAAYLVTKGMVPDDAWRAIRDVRPFIRPTGTQEQRLEEFAGIVHGEATA